MVTLIKLDTHWLPEDPCKISTLPLNRDGIVISGAFWYEAETELGTKRVNIPISEIIIVNDPIIRPNGATNSRNGYPYPEPIPLREALLEAKKRGGLYLEQRGPVYFVYRLKHPDRNPFIVEHFREDVYPDRRDNREIKASSPKQKKPRVLMYRLVGCSEDRRLMHVNGKKPIMRFSDVEMACSIRAFSPDGEERDVIELRKIASSLKTDPVYLVKDSIGINDAESWLVFRDKHGLG